MVTRITLDWDFKNRFKAIYYLFKIFSLGFECLIIEKSRKKGFHIQIWLKGKLSQNQKDTLRSKLGEDKAHLRMDKKHKYGKQTLFDLKKRI
jgi:hypothetical protein